MDPNNLTDAQKAALAKAEAAGVTAIHDGRTIDMSASGNVDATKAAADKAAADKAAADAAAAAAAATKPQRPDYIPEKFWDAEKGEARTEAMAKSYAELERARTALAATTAAAAAAVTKDVAKPADDTMAASKAAADAAAAAQTPEQKAAAEAAAAAAAATKVDPAAAATEARAAATADIAKDGKISDASYDKLAKAGFDRATVDAYVAGVQAKQTLYINSMHDAAGGKDQYKTMINWAGTNYSAEEVTAYDAAVRSGDAATMKLAVSGLKARFTAEFGKTTTAPIVPNPGDSKGSAGGYTSKTEVTKAMQDPRWKTGDPAYRREVTQNIAAGEKAGHDLGLNVMQS